MYIPNKQRSLLVGKFASVNTTLPASETENDANDRVKRTSAISVLSFLSSFFLRFDKLMNNDENQRKGAMNDGQEAIIDPFRVRGGWRIGSLAN